MNITNPKVDFYFDKSGPWHKELKALRTTILDCALDEQLKWGVPCYTFEKRNVILIHVFKEYCAVLFFKGALLKDSSGVLVQQTRNVQAARQMRFSNHREVVKMRATLKAYIYEAVETELAGIKVPFKKTSEYEIPVELQSRMNRNAKFKAAFEALTPGRQRGYLLYFSSAKLPKTREARIKKCEEQIFKGKGLND